MSEVKVNKLSPRLNCGTVTLGDSGDTFTIPAGVTITNNGTQTGFGRTGTVDWNTTAITADPANAVSGTGYFANTTSAAFTITLPTSPSAGDIVAVRDYAQTFSTNNLTIGRNGQPIDGQTFDLILNTNGAAVTLVYVDGTQGWKSVNSNETVNQALYVTATGGTVTCCGDYKIHTFTSPGTFCVSCGGNPAGSNTVDYLVVAGGGGGKFGAGFGGTGGGGAGGYRESSGAASGCYTRSPLGACVSALPVTATGYPITVGAGGSSAPSCCAGNKGNNSVFSTITSTGGGAGISNSPPANSNVIGGSGGGGRESQAGGAGNTPPVSPPQGNPGGSSACQQGGSGGGGAGASGSNAFSTAFGGDGGAGATSSINGTPTARAGGGGGGAQSGTNTSSDPASGGAGGGGAGGAGPGPDACMSAGGNGTANTGGGGGSSRNPTTAGSGGSGIVIIRYKYQ